MTVRDYLRIGLVVTMTAASVRASTNWTLNTADTRLTVGIDATGGLSITELSCPASGWNWTTTPSPFPLMSRVDIGATQYAAAWVYKGATVDTNSGTKVTMTFSNASPSLVLTSEWWARPGPGPVHHAMWIKNTGGQTTTVYEQDILDVHVVGPATNASLWHFSDDGQQAQDQGAWQDMLTNGYTRSLMCSEGNPGHQDYWPGNVRNGQDDIPYAVIDAAGSNGVYLGWEWSIGRIAVTAHSAPSGAYLKAGCSDDFKTDIDPNETIPIPPGFIGAYKGDVDDAGNSLRKYLFSYNMPVTIRDDPGYPKVEWNAFNATGGWSPVETNYRKLVDSIVTMGFEEVMLDVAWWDGDAFNYTLPPIGDLDRWPTPIEQQAAYAHNKGLRFGLYWAHRAYMTTTNGIGTRKAEIKYLYDTFQTDVYRSDAMGCGVLQYGPVGPLPFPNPEDQTYSLAHYEEDKSYYQARGFYDVLDTLYATITNFSYENCAAGGTIKDFGIMKRSFKIQNSDQYRPLDSQRALYDSLFMFPAMQLSGVVSKYDDMDSGNVANMKYWFRSGSMGAARLEPDNGDWNQQKSNDCAAAVSTYKTKIRPLIRSANVYHIFPRPDNLIWTGMQFHDPVTNKGVVYVFRPNNPSNTYTVKLKGLDSTKTYALTCEDGSITPHNQTGSSLMQSGLTVQLGQIFSSDLIFLEAVTPVPDPSSWTAFNDFALGAGQTNYHLTTNSPAAIGSSLTDYQTGISPLSAEGVFSIAGGTASLFPDNPGTIPPGSSDADQVFGGKVDGKGYANWSAGTVTLMFTNLNPGTLYDVALYCSRGSTNATYQTRYEQVTITSVNSFTNASSSGATITTVSMANDTTRIYATNNTGMLHRYVGINPGADGAIVFTVVGDGNGSYLNACMLKSATSAAPLVAVATNNWTAYNDCAWTNGDLAGGVFTTNSPSSLLSGSLRDTQGSNLPVQVSFTTGGALGVGLLGQNSQLAAGTDAATWFSGKIGTNCASQWTNGTVQMSVTGLDTARQYNIVIWSTRGLTGPNYSNRFTDITLSGADSFVNLSSVGTELSTVSTANDRTRVRASVAPGLVTRYDSISPGSDGAVAFTLTAGADLLWPASPTSPNGYLNAFMIQTVPVAGTGSLPSDWMLQYFQTTNVDPSADPDGDGRSNLQEYIAGCNPTNGASNPMLDLHMTNGALLADFSGVTQRMYSIDFRPNLHTAWTSLVSNIQGSNALQSVSLSSTNHEGYYRFRVNLLP